MALTSAMKLHILLSIRDRAVSPLGEIESVYPNIDFVKSTPWPDLTELNMDPSQGDPLCQDLFRSVGQVLYEDTHNRLQENEAFETAVRQDAPVLTRSIELMGSDIWFEPPHPSRAWVVEALT
jgi:hypothetical protein